MKKPFPQYSAASRKRTGGFALIIILSAIVLLLALVVGFFSRVQSEIQSSSSYQSAESARNLSEYAVNLVLTQIKAGTAGVDGSGNPLAWASQPGAIRTFNTSGDLTSVYKLYSSPTMVAATINPATEASALSSWSSNRALFTDLNEPLNGQYPILDPSADGIVKGFRIKGAPLESGTGANAAPMPAGWLYVLKDGKIVSPTGSGNTANVDGATSTNPIVGRIAFWTDDETSKININTAGGGIWDASAKPLSITYPYGGASTLTYDGPDFTSFWATPLVFTKQEGALAFTQPTKNEYQRYPGHPANTFLSAVFPGITEPSDLYKIIPRLQNEGSKGGTVDMDSSAAVSPDSERLYQTVDELQFQPSRTSLNPSITKTSLEQAKFFATAQSRAPDVNPFNEPKISLWPITTGKLTPFDRLIAFCSTINTNQKYYFERSQGGATSSTSDLNSRNKNILTYLLQKTSSAVPGFGGGSAGILGQYGQDDAKQTLTEVFDYIRSLNPRDSSQTTSGGAIDTSQYYSSSGAVVPIKHTDWNTRGFGRFPTISKVGLLIYGVGINQTASTAVTADSDRESKRSTMELRVAAPGSGTPPNTGKLIMQAALVFEMFSPSQGYHLFYPGCQVRISGLNTFQWENATMFPSAPAPLVFTEGSPTAWGYGNIALMWGGRIAIRQTVAPQPGAAYPFISTFSPEVNCRDSVIANPTFAFSGGTITIEIRSPNGAEVYQTLTATFPSTNFPVPDLAPYMKIDSSGSTWVDFRLPSGRLQAGTGDQANAMITDSDVVRSVAVGSGDFRIAAAQETVTNLLTEHPYYTDPSKMRAHNFFISLPAVYYGAGLGSYGDTSLVKSYNKYEIADGNANGGGSLYRSATNNWKKAADWSAGDPGTGGGSGVFTFSNQSYLADTYFNGVKVGGTGNVPGDWDNGAGRAGDGPYINFPDEGNIGEISGGKRIVPYLGGTTGMAELGAKYFTPNRVLSSPVMLGSLPSQAKSLKPWQTLLFRPTSAIRPGSGTPLTGPPYTLAPDFLLLDFFNMPVVEPYAISEPLSTAGRVNMNYQILPYTYITRSTAVQAVLRSEQMLAIPNSEALLYDKQSGNAKTQFRHFLNLSEETGTLKGFMDKFLTGDIFRSPSQICSIWLVPNIGGATYDEMPAWWNSYIPTGDNAKESSYARIYPRLTTKSNTYTVHYRVQALKKPKNATNHDEWVDGTDKVQSEYRGSTTIERYIDPNDPNIPDYITASNPEPLDSFYKFRIIGQKQFNP